MLAVREGYKSFFQGEGREGTKRKGGWDDTHPGNWPERPRFRGHANQECDAETFSLSDVFQTRPAKLLPALD